MRRIFPAIWLASALLLPRIALAAESEPLVKVVPSPAVGEPAKLKPVSVDFEGTPLAESLRKLAGEAHVVLLLSPEVDAKARVFAHLKDVDPLAAMKLITEAAGLVYQQSPGLVVVFNGKPSATVNGRQVPIVGAVTSAASLDLVPPRPAAGMPSLGPTRPPDFQGSDKLVDFEVTQSPLREAIARLSKASGIDMKVDEAVPAALKVIARIRKMPVGEVLSLLVGQANLTYMVANREEQYINEACKARIALVEQRVAAGVASKEELQDAKIAATRTRRIPTIYIVPKPELQVTGPAPSPGAPSLASQER
jgi:hypothetical protein